MMSSLLFQFPWVLAALAALPVLWWLLRATPPAPRLIKFPAIRFLRDLLPEQVTPHRTPWWLLLLRCLIAAFVILAIAAPVLHPGKELPGHGPLRVVVDNGWAAGPNWDAQVREAEDIAARAQREGREVYLSVTAPAQEKGPLTGEQAISQIKGLSPQPWPGQIDALAKKAANLSATTFWLGHGFNDGGLFELAGDLQGKGGFIYYQPSKENIPVLIRPDPKPGSELSVQLDTSRSIAGGTPVTVQAISRKGHVMEQQRVEIDPSTLPAQAVFDLPVDERANVAQIRIAGKRGAGSVLLLDESSQRRRVGIVSPLQADESKPFIDEAYYLTRALEPYADLITGTVEDILKTPPSVIILPDEGAMPPSTLSALEEWVRGGGLLLRFAGPKMTEGEAFLTPVPIRQGQRALDGTLSWENPQTLQPFPDSSPLADIPLRETITVKRQLLAQPVADLQEKTWAQLSDGTPLITAAPLDRGLLVMIHTTATPDWSDLPLSGVYVSILRRIVSLSAGLSAFQMQADTLTAQTVLDGFGNLTPPRNAKPVKRSAFDDAVPGEGTPPGLYGQGDFSRALNLGDHLPPLSPVISLPSGVTRQVYGQSAEKDLAPYFLSLAFILFLADWLIIMLMARGWSLPAWKRQAAPLILCLLLIPFSAHAQEKDIEYAQELHLAYMPSGDGSVDQMTARGLDTLAQILRMRTSAEPGETVALRPGDDLSFFPLIYWPVTDGTPSLSDNDARNIQSYLDHGGTILFDTRSRRDSAALARLTMPLNIPPLAPIAKDHVLGRSFYLLKTFPGQVSDPQLWVEDSSASGRDGVSSVIVGGGNWAAAWAENGRTRQSEMALRFGVNAVMYALTGNYKSDQVHLPHILERLSQ